MSEKLSAFEQIHLATDAVAKTVNAATELPDIETLHNAAVQAIQNAYEIIDSSVSNLSKSEQIAAEFEKEYVDGLKHQLDGSYFEN